MTYMVMEVHLSYCVVMDEAGHFLQVANINYEVGQIINEIIPIKTS